MVLKKIIVTKWSGFGIPDNLFHPINKIIRTEWIILLLEET